MNDTGWTIDTLKAYFDQRLADAEKRVADAKHSMDRAEDAAGTTRAYAEAKNNEFREQLADQAGMFMPRAEADQRYATTTAAVGALGESSRRDLAEVRDAARRDLDELRTATRRDYDTLRTSTDTSKSEQSRLIYIATGIAIAAGIAIPLLLR